MEKIVVRRDVFGQLPTGYGKSLTFQLLPGILNIFSETPNDNYLPVLRAKQLHVGQSRKKTASCKKATELPG